MKIAVTANGNTTESDISSRFGRCECFMIYDPDGGNWRELENMTDSGAEHGAGVSAAQRLVDESVGAVVTSNCGPKAKEVLEAANIDVYFMRQGTVAEALTEFNNGSLRSGT